MQVRGWDSAGLDECPSKKDEEGFSAYRQQHKPTTTTMTVESKQKWLDGRLRWTVCVRMGKEK